eukprot:15333516-Alexandrium_andersonii.AAC.1
MVPILPDPSLPSGLMATIPGEVALAVLATCMWAFLSPLAIATIPGGPVLTLQACCTVLSAVAV